MSAVIAIVLAIMIAAALWQTIRKFRRGGGCCGDHENVSLRQVSDRNRSHYPYHVILEIGGMTCDNCARKAANALNAMDDVWAEVSFDRKKADVLCKKQPDESAIRRAVSEAGYVVMDYSIL